MATLGGNSDMTATSDTTAWRVATVTSIRPEAPGLRSYTFEFDDPVKHDAGQHYEIRLTSEDGYQAARLYSAAMPANGTANMLQLTIALMPEGEVSSYLFHYLKPGSQVEIRGPLGRYFVWQPTQPDPVLLVGGGTGVIPLRCMRLAHQQAASQSQMKLLYSARSYPEMAYAYELFPLYGQPPEDVVMTFTKHAPDNWNGYARRIDAVMLEEVLASFETLPRAYVCGPNPFVERVAQLLQVAGLDPAKISAERFGSTV
jgi:ferredoxin-NADP reductase